MQCMKIHGQGCWWSDHHAVYKFNEVWITVSLTYTYIPGGSQWSYSHVRHSVLVASSTQIAMSPTYFTARIPRICLWNRIPFHEFYTCRYSTDSIFPTFTYVTLHVTLYISMDADRTRTCSFFVSAIHCIQRFPIPSTSLLAICDRQQEVWSHLLVSTSKVYHRNHGSFHCPWHFSQLGNVQHFSLL